MDINAWTALLAATIVAGTPILFAAAGELLAERSGILNLGVEGMMLVGAALGFIVTVNTGNHCLGLLAALAGGGSMAAIHALVSSGGFSLLFTYVVILLAHIRFRKSHGCPPYGHCQLGGFPYTSWIAIIGLLSVILTMPLIPGQGSGLFAGLGLILFYLAAYFMIKILPGIKKHENLMVAKPLLKTKPEPKDD
jgi:amino acid permease